MESRQSSLAYSAGVPDRFGQRVSRWAIQEQLCPMPLTLEPVAEATIGGTNGKEREGRVQQA